MQLTLDFQIFPSRSFCAMRMLNSNQKTPIPMLFFGGGGRHNIGGVTDEKLRSFEILSPHNIHQELTRLNIEGICSNFDFCLLHKEAVSVLKNKKLNDDSNNVRFI